MDVALSPPALQNNRADVDRLLAALAEELDVEKVEIDLDLMRALPPQLRDWDWRARCVLFWDHRWRLVGVSEPEGRGPVGAALDLGTTRLVLRLVDLSTGDHLGERSFDNPQIDVGPDILTRIHHTAEADGLQHLRQLVINGLCRELDGLCRELDVDRASIPLMTVAGNTSMTHLFLGLDPHWIIREPYIPVVNSPGLLRASELGLDLAPGAGVFVFPSIGSYFGGDLIAGILHSGLHRREEPAILVDVGTNAEVVIGNKDWLLGCAGAAGPALESGAASMGMMAGSGVIDRVSLAADGVTLELHTIGDEPPIGICGSGVIDLASCLFLSRRLDIQGRLSESACGDRYIESDGAGAFVVVPAAASGSGADLLISQPELDSLVRSKAAMFTILETIASAVGMTPEAFSRFYVAGTFGAFIDPRAAINIGMLPDLPLEAFQRLGNSSLGGATAALMRPRCAEEIAAIRDGITYLELNVNQDFMIRFSAAKFIPHTDPERFPSVDLARRKEA